MPRGDGVRLASDRPGASHPPRRDCGDRARRGGYSNASSLTLRVTICGLPARWESGRLVDMSSISGQSAPLPAAKPRSFRRAVFRGLALVLPPILTIVIFLWIYSTVQFYVLKPVTDAAREALVWCTWNVREPASADENRENRGAAQRAVLHFDGLPYVRLES